MELLRLAFQLLKQTGQKLLQKQNVSRGRLHYVTAPHYHPWRRRLPSPATRPAGACGMIFSLKTNAEYFDSIIYV